MASNYSSWPSIRGLLLGATELIQLNKKVHKVFIYGDSVENILILTRDDMVYTFVHDKNLSYLNTLEIETMSGKNIKTFTAGNCTISALTNTGKVYCWKQQTLSTSPPVEIKENGKYFLDLDSQMMRQKPDKCWAISDNGKLYMWETQHLLKSTFNPSNFNPILDRKKYISISCGGDCFILAVTVHKKVYGISYETYEDNDDYVECFYDNEEIEFPGNILIAKAICGYEHRLALSETGEIFVWGSNFCGELGIGSQEKIVNNPTQMKNHVMGTVLDIAALPYGKVSAAMGQDGKVYIWGQCMGQNIKEPLHCNFMSLTNALIYFSPTFPRNRTFTLQEERKDVASDLREAFDDTTTSDLIMEVQGKRIHVHKAILKIRSQYFRIMFQNHWRENNQDVIHNDQFSYDVFKGYLNYLYTDQIDLPDIDKNIAELLKLADAYNEISLMQLCRNYRPAQM